MLVGDGGEIYILLIIMINYSGYYQLFPPCDTVWVCFSYIYKPIYIDGLPRRYTLKPATPNFLLYFKVSTLPAAFNVADCSCIRFNSISGA